MPEKNDQPGAEKVLESDREGYWKTTRRDLMYTNEVSRSSSVSELKVGSDNDGSVALVGSVSSLTKLKESFRPGKVSQLIESASESR